MQAEVTVGRTAMSSDGQLLRDFLAGSEVAFERLYQRHEGRVWGAALALTAQPADAEEVVQMVFSELVSSARRLRKRTELGPHLVRAARNRARDLLRRRSTAARALRGAGDGAESFLVAPPDAPVELAEDARRASDALAELSADEREVVLLRACQGMKLEQISGETGVPVSTLHSRYGTALRKLAARLGGAG